MSHEPATSARPYGQDASVSVGSCASPEEEIARLREQLRASEARSCEVQQMARTGLWEWNVLTNDDFWSEELYRLFGEDPETFAPSFDGVLARVVPEDRERVRAVGYDALENRRSFALDFGIRCGDGTRKFVHSRGRIKPIAPAA